MSKYFNVFLLFLLVFNLSACGKYGPPLPPEAFSPRAIEDLQVSSKVSGVKFSWRSPSLDLQGEELEDLDGYFIFRRVAKNSAALVMDEEEFDEIARLEDVSVSEREERREVAREEGLPTRKISSKPELEYFEYLDEGLTPGVTYIYKIVPFNQGEVEGQVTQLIEIFFRGSSSEIRFVDESSFDTVL